MLKSSAALSQTTCKERKEKRKKEGKKRIFTWNDVPVAVTKDAQQRGKMDPPFTGECFVGHYLMV